MGEHRTSSCQRNLHSQTAEAHSNVQVAGTKIHISGTNSFTAPDRASSLRKNRDNLCWIDRRGHVAIDDLKFSPGGLVCHCAYFSLDNFAAVKPDPDAGPYAVIHVVSILSPTGEQKVRKRGRHAKGLLGGCLQINFR